MTGTAAPIRPLPAEAGRLLRDVFGHDAFRPGQAEIVAAVAAGRDTLAIMPTGGGKSLCFQLPALMRDGLTLVVSPLIALMRDQVRALQAAGVAAGALTSATPEDAAAAIHAALSEGRLKLLYMAPERLSGRWTERLLARANVTLIAVDEAHCVSQWGHDFRPDYLAIGPLAQRLGGVQTVALTATADAETRVEIARQLFPERPPLIFLRGFDRPNLHLAFQEKDQPRRQLLRFVADRRGRSGLVYAATRARTETLADALLAEGIPAIPYHAGMDPALRADAEARFQAEDGLVVCATVAFGMGVDKPDIRFVVHADLPKTIEGYYQEIGRAGRDGLPAETLTLYGPEDIRLRRAQIDAGAAPADRKAADHRRLNALLGLAEALSCRRQALLAYFGERLEAPCGNCDLCARRPAIVDGTELAQKALSAVLRTGQRFGAEHLIAILRGETTERVRALSHDRLPTFGVGRDLGRGAWRAVFRQLMGRDLIRPDAARHGALAVTEAARPVLRGEARLQLRRPDAPARPDRAAPAALVAEEDEGLFAALKARRRQLAEAQGVPAYVVFPDATLIAMAQEKPTDPDALRRLPGVGAVKLERYGAAFLEVIVGAAPARRHPARERLAGRADGRLMDRLAEAQARLARGDSGLETYLACDARTLARIVRNRPRDLAGLARLPGMGEAKAARFGPAFLALLATEDDGAP